MGQLIIPPSAVVYADTSIFIYTVEVNPDYYSLFQPLWLLFQAGDIEIISSELTLMETLVVPTRNSNSDLSNAYEQLLLSPAISLVLISQTVLKEAVRLRAMTNLKSPDAIHAATALSENCTMLLTNDSQFRNVTGLAIVVFNEVLAS